MQIKKTRLFLTLASGLFLGTHSGYSQGNNLYGYVTDSISGEAIVGATVLLQKSLAGTSANSYGFYTLPLSAAGQTVEVQISALGYITLSRVINTSQKNWDFQLRPAAYELKEATVVSPRTDHLGTHDQFFIEPLKVRELPRLLGEADPLKYLQTLPGVKQGREGSTGLYVRGGTPDQNLMLLDGVPIYNVNHLFGYFSVFNADAIKNIRLYKSGIPARYEGRLSSVVDITMKEGNLKTPKKILSVSPIAGTLMLEGPIKVDKSSYMITARRTWLDGLLRAFSLGTENNRGFQFYDLNGKYQNKLNSKNTLYASAYGSKDRFYNVYNSGGGERAKYSFNWGNFTGLLRWNTQLKDNAFLSTSVSYSNYTFKQQDENSYNRLKQSREVNSSIKEWNLTSAVDYYPHYRHEIKAGVQISHKTFEPEILQITNNFISTVKTNDLSRESFNPSFFIEDLIKISPQALLEIGVRNSFYFQNNKSNVYVQPRAKVSYAPSDDVSVAASYDHLAQHIHLLTNTTLGQPTDLWLPATAKAPTELSHQYNLSIQKSFPGYTLSASTYFKRISNVIEYIEGSSIIYGIDQGWEDKIAVGKGTSRGVEWIAVKRSGKLNGHISYTLSKTDRHFAEVNNGNTFPFKYDRRHDGTILAVYQVNKRNKFSALFTYNTGNAFTLPVARTEGMLPPNWELLNHEGLISNMKNKDLIVERNNVRMPAYHRADVSYSYVKEKENNSIRTWDFSIYNVYNRLNPYFIFESEGKLKQYAFFPIIPSVSYRLEF